MGTNGRRRTCFRSPPLYRCLPFLTAALALCPLGLCDIAERPGIEVGEAQAEVNSFGVLDAAGNTMDSAMRIDRNEVAPVAAREHPAFLL
jgi:hypothetical protein